MKVMLLNKRRRNNKPNTLISYSLEHLRKIIPGIDKCVVTNDNFEYKLIGGSIFDITLEDIDKITKHMYMVHVSFCNKKDIMKLHLQFTNDDMFFENNGDYNEN